MAVFRRSVSRIIRDKDVLSGLVFVAVALLALWLGRNFRIGTAVRMGTGYVPMLVAWSLFGLGVLTMLKGLLMPEDEEGASWPDGALRPLIAITAAVCAFGFGIERLGLVLTIFLVVGIGSFALKGQSLLGVLIAAAVLAGASVLIFSYGLSLTMPIWPVT